MWTRLRKGGHLFQPQQFSLYQKVKKNEWYKMLIFMQTVELIARRFWTCFFFFRFKGAPCTVIWPGNKCLLSMQVKIFSFFIIHTLSLPLWLQCIFFLPIAHIHFYSPPQANGGISLCCDCWRLVGNSKFWENYKKIRGIFVAMMLKSVLATKQPGTNVLAFWMSSFYKYYKTAFFLVHIILLPTSTTLFKFKAREPQSFKD